MEFDISKFTGATFTPREEDVQVPGLKAFFTGEPEKDDKGNPKPPVWRVRGLKGAELAKANEAVEMNRNRSAIAEALASGKDQKITEALRELIGNGEKVPDDTAKRIEMLTLGSVSPECSGQLAVKLAEAFPIEFTQLTNKIMQLTGLGGEPGKPKRSSGKTKSASRSASAT
ncbi:hypothetical protein [Halomonas koreensis]|uniref:Uncharacterized protein n=1 Tax=Halomonas koreensis TaxID=245385 RepID=A0ABU1G2X9_9GAMM|nr:hypothetical protein [Halomonas koreensis]MDR5867302.1 hypothetical protein [Halomonas koreensis]